MADNQGSFVTGMAIGLFAGAASYFVLMTPEGKKMRKRLEKEWQEAQAAGIGTLPSSDPNVISVKSFFGTLRQAISDAAESSQPKTVSTSTKKTKKPAAKKTDARFKGV